MPDKPKTKSKGKGLSKKLGPFPTYVWIAGGAIVVLGYLYYRKRSSASSAAAPGSSNQSIIPSGVVIPSSTTGATDTTGNTDTSASSPNTFPTDYATQTDLQSGLDNLGNQVGAQIAAITFPQPTVNITVPPAHVATSTVASKTAAKKAAVASAPAHITYQTYKKNVSLKAGQTLHYAKGKGYYAA